MAEKTAEEQPDNPQPAQLEPQEEAAATVDGDEGEKKKAQPPSLGYPSMTFNIWPPSQRTREAVINRLVETLAKESILSKRYGAIPHDEASTMARRIEEEAFSAAAASAPTSADASSDVPAADDIEIATLQMYSKEISKRMLSTVKARASASSSSPASTTLLETPAASEEASSVKSEPL